MLCKIKFEMFNRGNTMLYRTGQFNIKNIEEKFKHSAKRLKLPTMPKLKDDRRGSFHHFPQAMFFINKNMELVGTNEKGTDAIEKHWISVERNKVNFNTKDNTLYVQGLIDRLVRGESKSERFILPCIDTVYRAYTLSCSSESHNTFLLCIQNDSLDKENRLEALAKAFSFTKAESKVVVEMVKGLKPKQIAFEAGISLATVRSHLRTIYAKMNVRDYNDAMMLCVRLLV